ncbi:MAG: class I tRNA ligase family protein, partial [Patescibacteria group bacterium]
AEQSSYDGNPQTWKAEQSSYDGNPRTQRAEQSSYDGVRIIPEYRKNEMLSFFRSGLEDVSFSRPRKDLLWGIPVPHDGSQTMYVWADALINYISVLSSEKKKSVFKSNSPEMKKWWPPELHVVGKDILRFHALIWLGMLLSLELKLPKSIFVHGFINVDGEKMSKSLGNVLDPVFLAKKYGTDALRYYLLREVPSGEDGNFSIEAFEARYNGDCANGLGNLTARVAALGEKLGSFPFSEKSADTLLKKEIKLREKKFKTYMDDFRFSEALSEVWQLIGFLDRYINAEKPWLVLDRAKLTGIIKNASIGILKISSLLTPLLPETSEKISSMFSLKRRHLLITKGDSLFPRLP